ncbi:Origin recognition complex subunit 2 [Puttea exsequens]|nr:Origin recognition complex subunit 2 [Puttea exsequens]
MDGIAAHFETASENEEPVHTPRKSRLGRPRGSGNKATSVPDGVHELRSETILADGRAVGLPTTPSKSRGPGDSRREAQNAQQLDRSAKRKSVRTLIEKPVNDGVSDEEDSEDEDTLARKIWEADEAESDEQQDGSENDVGAESAGPKTPSMRKKGKRRKSPTPPQNLPPHEQYFWQNRPGKIKTSNSTLSSLSLLTHEQYHKEINAFEDPHESSFAFLHSLHCRSFPQWRFELSESYNICLYGYGSKRKLVTAFANYLHRSSPTKPPKILVVNGYAPSVTLRQLLTTLATLVFDCTPTHLPSHLGSQPRDILTILLSHLNTHPPSTPYQVFINSLDAPPLRRSPTPALLAQLAAHPQINLLATCDSPTFPLLWNTHLRDQFNFVFHDTTTFQSYASVEIPSVVDSVNELLNRSGRNIKGKEGVGFVLRSLPENARNLYRVLIAEILAIIDDGGGDVGDAGVDYKVLYQKVVEEFICSSEMGFRQLLKEFYDHQMIVSRREGGGAEILGVPWRREEMKGILEDLMV